MENHQDFSKMKIETERLRLEAISPRWKEEIFQEFTDEITTYMFPRPAKNIGETEAFITQSQEENKEGKNCQLVVLLKETGEFLGCAGLHEPHTRRPELGIWLKKSAQGKGYGKEVMTTLKEWADAHIEYEYIVYPVDRDNLPSRKIPETPGGMISDEYSKKNMGGNILHTVEYRIYPERS